MKSVFKTFMMGATALVITNCAAKPTQDEVKLANEVQTQPAREMHGGVAAKGMEAILSSNSLTEAQKKQLLSLHGEMAKETFKIQEETSKLKGVLFETITAKPYDRSKVNALKKKLVTLNDKKMKNMFEALDKVQGIIGEKSDTDIQDFYRPFFWEQAHQFQAQ
jgi:Spy/CpxP family protein refolding chaperone